jgi:hypothetical protein
MLLNRGDRKHNLCSHIEEQHNALTSLLVHFLVVTALLASLLASTNGG